MIDMQLHVQEKVVQNHAPDDILKNHRSQKKRNGSTISPTANLMLNLKSYCLLKIY